METSNPLVISAGQTHAYLSIDITSDEMNEQDETIEINLGAPSNAQRGSPRTHVLTIRDDDFPPVVNFVQSNQYVEENVGSVSINIQLTAPSSEEVVIPLTLGGSAVQGSDFILSQTSVAIPAGSTVAIVTLEVVDDHLSEVSETIIISMEQPTNAALGTLYTHAISIQASDQATCNIFSSNELVFWDDLSSLSWTLSNLGQDTLYLKQLTI